jgi:hypothetical protein
LRWGRTKLSGELTRSTKHSDSADKFGISGAALSAESRKGYSWQVRHASLRASFAHKCQGPLTFCSYSTLALHLPRQPFPPLDAHLEGQRQPGLQSNAHPPKVALQKVKAEMQALPLSRPQPPLALLPVPPDTGRLARLRPAQDTHQPFLHDGSPPDVRTQHHAGYRRGRLVLVAAPPRCAARHGLEGNPCGIKAVLSIVGRNLSSDFYLDKLGYAVIVYWGCRSRLCERRTEVRDLQMGAALRAEPRVDALSLRRRPTLAPAMLAATRRNPPARAAKGASAR